MKSFAYRSIVLAAASFLTSGLTAAADPPSAADAALFERLDSDHNGQVAAGEVSAEHKRLFARLLRHGDADGNQSLSRDEFIAGLVPTRPEKPLEEKQSALNPQSEAVRWLLLTMDTSGNSSIEEDEVPERLQRVFGSMVRRIDGDKDGAISRRELNQGNRQLAQIAGRYVETEGIDTTAELKKLEKKLGAAAGRFDAPPPRLENLGDPEQARQVFAQLDGNGSGQIERAEIPEQLQRPLERLMRQADRNNDGQLSESEFLAGARQIARRQQRQDGRTMPAPESMPAEKAMPAEESMPADGK